MSFKSFSVSLPAEDCRNDIPTDPTGVYMVQKKNIIKEFRWNQSSAFKSSAEANAALHQFLSGRKDAAGLRVTVMSGEGF